MNTYEEPSLFSGRKGVALTTVILLHLMFGFAFYSELGAQIKKLDLPPLNLTPIEPPKQTIKPPPAVPVIDRPKIYASPPEFPPLAPSSDSDVTVEVTPPDPPTMIAQTSPLSRSTRVPVRMDPKHPLRIGHDYYPDASIRANEMGRCVVQVTVAADGRIIAAAIQASSGFDRLDQACLNGVRGQRMLPATEDGRPIESTVSIPIVWNLSQ
jgi:protein TonB